jgi:exocyst complex component 2
LEKACESLAEALENPGHQRRPTRGSEDAASDGQASVSPDDLLVSDPKCSASGLLICKLMIDVKYICHFLRRTMYNRKKTFSALQVLAQQYSSDLLQAELERTRLNIACFMESTIQSTSAPAGSKSAAYSSYQAPAPQHAPVQTSSPSFRRQQTGSSSPVVSRRRR